MGLYAELLRCLRTMCMPADDVWMSSTCGADGVQMTSSAHGADIVHR